MLQLKAHLAGARTHYVHTAYTLKLIAFHLIPCEFLGLGQAAMPTSPTEIRSNHFRTEQNHRNVAVSSTINGITRPNETVGKQQLEHDYSIDPIHAKKFPSID